MFESGGRVNHGVGVGNVAVGNHAFQVPAGNGQDEGVGAGAHQQAVVRSFNHAAVGGRGAHDALDTVHLGDGLARVQGDAVFFVPAEGVEDDFFQRLLAGQHRAQQDAVVVGMGLGAEHRDVIQLRGNFE